MFIGGFTLKEAVNTAKRLSRNGIGAIIDYAKEGSKTAHDVKGYVDEMSKVATHINYGQPSTHVALKISSFLIGDKVANDKLFELVGTLRAPIMFDAETPKLKQIEDETYETLVSKFPDHLVYKTIQAYRVDSEHDLVNALHRGVPIKLVRGAYWQKDNATLYQSKCLTDTNFNQLARLLIFHSRAPFCIATHNITSIEQVKNITRPHDKRLMFAQLLGMGNRITKQLAWDGYKVYKYVPYGSLNEMTPYLARRLVENLPILTHIMH
jgi:proline dehydrogenase